MRASGLTTSPAAISKSQANSLAITRIEGQDTQRAFASVRWDMRRLTPWGQELTLTAYGRGDVYHTDDAQATATAIYQGTDGWHARAIGALAADVQWPFIGPAFGGIQRLVPRVQLVLTPPTPNMDIPNEDARSVDLEDSNLFALNRFPGYDRWEDASRITYGVDWSLDRDNLSIESTIGQSFRFGTPATTFSLTERALKGESQTSSEEPRSGSAGSSTSLTAIGVDKNNFAVRRNEVDLTVGTTQTYAQVGYLRLNRNIDPSIEDLARRGRAAAGGARGVHALLVGVRSDGHRPHRQAGRPAVAGERLSAGPQPPRHRI